MPATTDLLPKPFQLDGGSTGVLLLHGYTGSPPEMIRIGRYLNDHGLTVSAPLLPGHGTTAAALNTTKWQAWASAAAVACDQLQERCATVFIAGLSMGSLLTLYLASQRPRLPGIITYSPPLKLADWRAPLVPILKHAMPLVDKGKPVYTDADAANYIWSYDQEPVFAAHEVVKLRNAVRSRLPRINVPILIMHSTLDTTIHAASAQTLYDEIGSADKTLITLHNSSHVITVDAEWQRVAIETHAFIESHLRQA
jgi:carboxylesterase